MMQDMRGVGTHYTHNAPRFALDLCRSCFLFLECVICTGAHTALHVAFCYVEVEQAVEGWGRR